MRKWALISSFILVALGGGIFWVVQRPVPVPLVENYQERTFQPPANSDVNAEEILSAAVDGTEETLTQPPTPEPAGHAITILPVPFTVQAPYANWDLPYQEACEEASMIMLVDFVLGRKDLRLPPAEADDRILELVQWEANNGYTIDITVAEVVEVLQKRFNIKAAVRPYSAEAVRQEISAGRPVILPAAGRLLGNPYFRTPGPLYHMLVVKGYEGDEFITNDPGTKRGENFRYHYSAFDKAVHDWNGGDVGNGQQVMVVLKLDS